jgi:hypothetical protein
MSFEQFYQSVLAQESSQAPTITAHVSKEVPHNDYTPHNKYTYEYSVHTNRAHTDQPSHDKYYVYVDQHSYNNYYNNYTTPSGQKVDYQVDESGPHSFYSSGPAHRDGAGPHNNTSAIDKKEPSSSHTDRSPHTNNYTTHSNTGFDHVNYVPSSPAIFNESLQKGIPLRDTAAIQLVSIDNNLQRGQGTQDAQSRDIYFSVELRKVSSFDGTTVSSADADWHYVGGYTQSPLKGGNAVTHTALPVQQADSSGKAAFSINTRNPFNKPGANAKAEEGVYQLRLVAWNTYRTGNGVTKYYVSATRYEDVEFRQNFIPEVSLTNELNVLNVVFSELGVKTSEPRYRPYAEGIYSNAYATANDETEGIFVRFSMRDQDPAGSQWQKATATLNRSDGTAIKTVDVFFSETTSKGTTVVQSDGAWKTGYAYFDKSVFPLGVDLAGCTVTISVSDYLNLACTEAVGTYALHSTTLDIDTKIPAIANFTQTAGLNTSTVKPGVGIENTVYAMRFKLRAVDSHPNTKLRTVQYAITNSAATPATMVPVMVDAAGYFTPPPITANGTYYVHVYAQDYAGNEHTAVYGPYTRFFEPELYDPNNPGGPADPTGTGGDSGVYLAESKSAGKTHTHPGNGLSLTVNARREYEQGYAITLRVFSRGADQIDLSVQHNDAMIPVRFLGYRKYEQGFSLPAFSNAGNVFRQSMVVGGILPPAMIDADGHIIMDDGVYVAEYELYLHRDTVLRSGSNVGKTLGLKLILVGQPVYPEDHPLAGQSVTTEISIPDTLVITDSVLRDGGTNPTN